MSFTESVDQIVQENSSGLLAAHASWARTRVSEVATILNGFPFPSARFRGDSGTPLVRIRDVQSYRSETFFDGEFDAAYLIERGDLLIGMDGDFPSALWKGEKALLNQRVCRVTPDERFYSRRLLAAVLPGYLASINQRTSSITVKHLSSYTVAEIPLPLPPRKEQDRLADALDSYLSRLDDAVASLERVQRNLKRYRAAVLQAAVEGRLVPTEAELARAEGRSFEPASELLARILAERRRRWEEAELARLHAKGKEPQNDAWKAKYVEVVCPDAAVVPELPEGWTWTTLGQPFEVVVGATPSRRKPDYWGGSIPWVSSGEVAFCRIKQTRETITQAGLENASTKLNPRGTVLLGMIGEGRTRGQCAILDIDACNNQNAAAIRVSDSGLPPEFTYYFLMSRYDQTRSIASGGNQPALNKSRVESIPLPLPPIAEQHRIVEEVERRLSVADDAEHSLTTQLTRCHRLRQSILKWAFEGKLVDQDPSDEPASVLLDRIRAERSAASTPSLGPQTRRPRSRGARAKQG